MMSRVMLKDDGYQPVDVLPSKNSFFDAYIAPVVGFFSQHKNNVLLISLKLTLLSLVITWMIELLANEILLRS